MLGMATLTMVRSSSVMKRPNASTASASQGEYDRRVCDMVSKPPWIERKFPSPVAGPFTNRWLASSPGRHRLLVRLHLLVGDPQLPILDFLDRAPHPLELGSVHREAVFAFDHEEPWQVHLCRQIPELGVHGRDASLQPNRPHLEQVNNLLLCEAAHKGQGRRELRVLVRRLGQQFPP